MTYPIDDIEHLANSMVRIRGYEPHQYRWPWPKQPHTCPVCKGRGQVLLGFYSGDGHSLGRNTTVPCRSCGGNGIVWQP